MQSHGWKKKIAVEPGLQQDLLCSQRVLTVPTALSCPVPCSHWVHTRPDFSTSTLAWNVTVLKADLTAHLLVYDQLGTLFLFLIADINGTITCILTILWDRNYYYPYFTDERIESYREVLDRPQSLEMAELWPEPSCLKPKLLFSQTSSRTHFCELWWKASWKNLTDNYTHIYVI